MSDQGAYFVMSACVGCDRVFTYNPHLVPSIRVSRVDGQWRENPNGSKEPVCESCVRAANPIRQQNGLDPIEILPGAYERALTPAEVTAGVDRLLDEIHPT